MNAGCSPADFPLIEEGVLLFDGLEPAALERGALGVLDGVLDSALAVWVTYPGRVGNDTVVGQHISVDGVEFGFVQVGLDDALLELIEDDVAAAATEVAPGCFFGFCVFADR